MTETGQDYRMRPRPEELNLKISTLKMQLPKTAAALPDMLREMNQLFKIQKTQISDPAFLESIRKDFIELAKLDPSIRREMDSARKSGIKLPTWAYPDYVVKAFPECFASGKLKTVPSLVEK